MLPNNRFDSGRFPGKLASVPNPYNGKSWHGTQVCEVEAMFAALAHGSRACYAGGKPQFRILCGSD